MIKHAYKLGCNHASSFKATIEHRLLRSHYLFFFEGELLSERGHLLVSLGHVEGGEAVGLGGHLLQAPLQIIALTLLALQA